MEYAEHRYKQINFKMKLTVSSIIIQCCRQNALHLVYKVGVLSSGLLGRRLHAWHTRFPHWLYTNQISIYGKGAQRKIDSYHTEKESIEYGFIVIYQGYHASLSN